MKGSVTLKIVITTIDPDQEDIDGVIQKKLDEFVRDICNIVEACIEEEVRVFNDSFDEKLTGLGEDYKPILQSEIEEW